MSRGIFKKIQKGYDFLNNTPNSMVHYRIKSTAKTPSKPYFGNMYTLLSTTAVVFSIISAAASVAVYRKTKHRK